jgi:CRP/FNR family transcriptional regulator
MQCESCPVRGHGVVCDLPLDTLADFRAAGTTTVYRPRQVIFAEGQPAPGLYVVCSGAVKLYHVDRFGREHVLDVVQPGAVVGEIALDRSQQVSVTAEAMSESQLSFIPGQSLPRFLERHPDAGMRMLVALSQALARAQRRVRELALKGAEGRLATLLLELAGAEDQPVAVQLPRLRYKRRELADMIGVSTETAIRLLTKLKTKGVLASEGRDIVVRDIDQLRKIANQDV